MGVHVSLKAAIEDLEGARELRLWDPELGVTLDLVYPEQKEPWFKACVGCKSFARVIGHPPSNPVVFSRKTALMIGEPGKGEWDATACADDGLSAWVVEHFWHVAEIPAVWLGGLRRRMDWFVLSVPIPAEKGRTAKVCLPVAEPYGRKSVGDRVVDLFISRPVYELGVRCARISSRVFVIHSRYMPGSPSEHMEVDATLEGEVITMGYLGMDRKVRVHLEPSRAVRFDPSEGVLRAEDPKGEVFIMYGPYKGPAKVGGYSVPHTENFAVLVLER